MIQIYLQACIYECATYVYLYVHIYSCMSKCKLECNLNTIKSWHLEAFNLGEINIDI